MSLTILGYYKIMWNYHTSHVCETIVGIKGAKGTSLHFKVE